MNLVLASVYNNYKKQVTERAVQFHELRHNGLVAAFQKLDTNKSGYVRIASCARLLGELSRPSISMFNWEMSRYTSSKKTQVRTVLEKNKKKNEFFIFFVFLFFCLFVSNT